MISLGATEGGLEGCRNEEQLGLGSALSWMTGTFGKTTNESECRGSVDAEGATEGDGFDGLRKKEPKKDDLLVEGAGGGGAAGSVRTGTEGG